MADNLDKPSFFGIENTMEMSMGDPKIVNDLFGSNIDPDDVSSLEENDPSKPESKEPKQAPKKVEKKKNEPSEEELEAQKKEKEKEQKSLKDFLSDESQEDEEIESSDDTQKTVEQEEEEQNVYGSLAKDLHKLNVFTLDEGEEELEINSPEEFLDRFNHEKKKGAIQMVDNFLSQFGEEYRNAFDAIFVNGVDPKDYFALASNIENLSELNLGEETNQIAVIKQALKEQDFAPEDISAEVERLKNYGDLETVATRYHKMLVKKESAKLEQLEQQKQQELQARIAQKQQYTKNVQTILQNKLKEKEFDGIPINPSLATELHDFLVTDKYKTPSGELLTDFDKAVLDLKRPENHEKKIKVALLLKIIEKDPTLSSIQKKGLTTKSNTLFNELARREEKASRKGASAKSTSWFEKEE